jgi:hypothetical protein
MRTRTIAIGVVCAAVALSTAATARAQTTYDRVVVVVFENSDRTVVMAQPTFASFAAANSADTGVSRSPVSTGYHEFGAYPSLPNYLMLVSGDAQACTTDACLTNGGRNGLITPAYPAPTIFSQLGPTGSQTLAELEPSPCYLANSGLSQNRYIVHHNPEVYFTSSSPACASNDKPYPTTGSLDLSAAFTMIVPSKCHQGHPPCTVANADAWLAGELPRIRAALSGHWALVVTFDEGSSGGTKTAVYFAVQTSDALQVQQAVSATHGDALATIQAELGLPVLGPGDGTLLAPLFGGLPTPPPAAALIP